MLSHHLQASSQRVFNIENWRMSKPLGRPAEQRPGKVATSWMTSGRAEITGNFYQWSQVPGAPKWVIQKNMHKPKKTSFLLSAEAHGSSFLARPPVTLDQLPQTRVKAFCWLLILEPSINSMYNNPHHFSSHIYTYQIDEVNEDMSWINVHSYLGLSWRR